MTPIAAALVQSVVGRHAPVDGDERPDWRSVAVFVEIDDASVAIASDDDVDSSVLEVPEAGLALDRPQLSEPSLRLVCRCRRAFRRRCGHRR